MNVALGETASECFEIGAWINVIGYVKVSASADRKRKSADNTANDNGQKVLVVAIWVWTAGAIRINDYEKILESQKEARKAAVSMQAQLL